MALINPYIHFNGNAREAFTFYKSVFGGEFARVLYYKDLSIPGYKIPESDAGRLMNIALPIGQGTVLRGSDTIAAMGQVTENDNRNAIFISAETREEADKLVTGLSAGGMVEMPLADGPFGSYFGMFTDKYGIEWMIDFTAPV